LTGAPDLNILLAFDFGLRRLGVATGNLHTTTASPLTTLNAGQGLPWAELDRMVEEWQPGQLVVGLPDAERAAAVYRQAREFAEVLGRRYQLPVSMVDEALTSQAAESALKEARQSGVMRSRVKKEQIDSHAACLIAEQWMNTGVYERPTD